MLLPFELNNPITDGALSRFPPEILARIFRFAWPDIGLLRICGIINKSFRSFACRLTFDSICCGQLTAITRSIKRWLLFVMDSPHLQHYIRDITVIGRFPDRANHLARLVRACHRGIPLRTLTLNTPRMLNIACSPNDSHTILSPFPNLCIDGNDIDANICFHMLINACMLASLEIGLRESCRYLNVGDDTKPVVESVSQGLNTLRIRLTSDDNRDRLSDDGVMRVFLRVQQHVQWRLHTFEFCAPARCSSGLAIFLNLIIPSLHSLALRVYDQESIFWPTINFDEFINLTELSLGLAEENLKATQNAAILPFSYRMADKNSDGVIEYGEMELHLFSKLALFEACMWREPYEAKFIMPEKIIRGLVYGNRSMGPSIVNVPINGSRHRIQSVDPQYYLRDRHVHEPRRRFVEYICQADRRVCYHIRSCSFQFPRDADKIMNAKNDIVTSFISAEPHWPAHTKKWYGNVLILKTFNGELDHIFKGDRPIIDVLVERFVCEYVKIQNT
ncbi:hypothetical protein BDZ89DRAFT_1129843 [Hymenopellis radicata]|nr:hypothetical protein BDZ89DRAFT_1129843 [Hymenopellis radicata]